MSTFLSGPSVLLGPSVMVHHALQQLPGVRPRTERGASLIEYALLIALIAIVCVAGVAALGQATNSRFDSFSTSL